MKLRWSSALGYAAAVLVAVAGSWYTSRYSYLLFHSLIEAFGVCVAAALFAVAWNTRRLSSNGYLTHLGIAYLFVGCIDLLHLLAYKGMGVFPGHGADTATQLWIAARSMEAVTLLASPIFLTRRLRPAPALAANATVAALLLATIFPLDIFPACYTEGGPGAGLTPFKIGAEYVICIVLCAALAAGWRVRQRFTPDVFALVATAIALTIVSELAFTQYVSVYGDFNLIGHLFKAASFVAVFQATVAANLRDPYHVLFRDLEQQQVATRAAAARLQENALHLEELNRVKDEFLATLSHELRTPMHAIVGWTEMLLRGSLDEAATRRAHQAIARNAKVQSRLIDDVLDVSRIITGKLRFELRRVDVSEPIAAAVDAIRPTATIKGVNLVVADLPRLCVLGDRDRLQQVFWNLLSNAVKFTPADGRVDVAVRRHGTDVEIRVTDSGAGINPSAVAHLFERFWQADTSSTRQHGGLGLGLAIVRHLVELHGGQVRAESRGEGWGSRFTVSLPLGAGVESSLGSAAAPAGAGEPAGEGGWVPALAGIKVLVVDDDEDAGEVVEAALVACGVVVRRVTTARDALRLVAAWRPAVVVSDIAMPAEDGYALIAGVRALPTEQGGHTRVIALTAHGREQDRQRALSAGFDAYLRKPATAAAITATVAGLLSAEPSVRTLAGDPPGTNEVSP